MRRWASCSAIQSVCVLQAAMATSSAGSTDYASKMTYERPRWWTGCSPTRATSPRSGPGSAGPMRPKTSSPSGSSRDSRGVGCSYSKRTCGALLWTAPRRRICLTCCHRRSHSASSSRSPSRSWITKARALRRDIRFSRPPGIRPESWRERPSLHRRPRARRTRGVGVVSTRIAASRRRR